MKHPVIAAITVVSTLIAKSALASTFVFVHGAFGDAHAWDSVKPVLEAAGHHVIAVNLPAHGGDSTPVSDISLQSYVRTTEQALSSVSGKVVLVGHSLSGMVISQVAEDMPQKIERLVYVSAFVPKNGDSAIALLQKDKQSILGSFLDFSADKSTATIRPDGRVAAVCADCPEPVKQFLSQNNAVEPMQPFSDKVHLTKAHFGKVQKAYIFTSQDKALGYNIQKWMVKRTGIKRTATFDTSHLSFIVDPNGFSNQLVQLTK